jgi:hypothetical protein
MAADQSRYVEIGQVIGMLSMRHLMRERIGELALKNADLVAFISTDGAGGD